MPSKTLIVQIKSIEEIKYPSYNKLKILLRLKVLTLCFFIYNSIMLSKMAWEVFDFNNPLFHVKTFIVLVIVSDCIVIVLNGLKMYCCSRMIMNKNYEEYNLAMKDFQSIIYIGLYLEQKKFILKYGFAIEGVYNFIVMTLGMIDYFDNVYHQTRYIQNYYVIILCIGYFRVILLLVQFCILGQREKDEKQKIYKLVNNQDDNQCSICLQNYLRLDLLIGLECNQKHIFHLDCIDLWRKSKKECPICRAQI